MARNKGYKPPVEWTEIIEDGKVIGRWRVDDGTLFVRDMDFRGKQVRPVQGNNAAFARLILGELIAEARLEDENRKKP